MDTSSETIENSEFRIGIFVCQCGGNISNVVDVDEVSKVASTWKHVVTAQNNPFTCSKPSQEIITKTIKEKKLNRVIIASCSPRLHLITFQSMLERVGLNPYLLEFVNIREQCSWVHGPQLSEEATHKAISLLRGGYERSLELEPLEIITEPTSSNVLVIGGGIAGMMAALELGNMGFKVYLVERQPSIGGNMAKLTKVFPTLDCAQCILTPRMAEVERNENVTLLTYSEVREIGGRPGNYNVKVFVKPRGVDLEKCTSCGDCAVDCPVKCINEFEEKLLSKRSAAYIPFLQAVPQVYTIDENHCLYHKYGICRICEKMCPADAINLDNKGQILELRVGSIVVATGYETYDARKIEEYGYGIYPDVITMLQLERLTSLFGPTKGHVKRLSDGKTAKKIAILLCAGSRDKNRYIPYCSRICCMYSIKQATLLKEYYEGIDVWVFYTDIRATGRGYEELYWRAEEEGVRFIRGKVSEVWQKKNGKVMIRAEDTLTQNVIEEPFDLVALATPMIPSKGLDALADMMKIPLGGDEFIQERHVKLNPVDSLQTGIFTCGCAIGPKDVRDTVSDALGSAARVSSFLSKGYIVTSPEKAVVDITKCTGCKICLEVCPSSAITMIEGKAKVDPLLCIECGACVPECPEAAIDFKNFTEKQIIAQLWGLLQDKEPDETRIIAFVDKTIGYTGLDFIGQDRQKYPFEIRAIRVPSTALLSLKHIRYAFGIGADGIVVIEGDATREKFTKKRIDEIIDQMEDIDIEGSRIYYSTVELPAYKKIANIFETQAKMVSELGPIPEDIRAQLLDSIKIEKVA
ncbi:MAG: hydrogenase iron-sulfur subunit [Promethearchaeota archaeon]